MSRRARWEVLTAVYPRYRGAARVDKRTMLDAFCQTTGYQRKYALRPLNGPPPARSGRVGAGARRHTGSR
jgi:hypothetical protein